MLILGVDEAGRGPVIGPLVMCGVVISTNKLNKLEELGVKDSKLLSKKKREELFEKIKNIVKEYHLIIINPQEIDDAIHSENLNLNKLEALKTIEIILKLKPIKAFIDCPDVTPENYKNLLKTKINDVELIVEHKAERYAVVAAASILAKVTRDRIIEDLKKKLKIDFGSGYSSDPFTQKFMKNFWNEKKYLKIIRKSWATYKNLKEKNIQKTLI